MNKYSSKYVIRPLCVFVCYQQDLACYVFVKYNLLCFQIYKERVHFVISSPFINLNKSAKGMAKSKQESNNKMCHSLNGNILSKKHLSIIQINKGNSKFHNVGKELLDVINENNVDICILSEANLDINCPETNICVFSTFKKFNIEIKTNVGTSNARMILTIKK